MGPAHSLGLFIAIISAIGTTTAHACNGDNVLQGIKHHHDYHFCSEFLATTCTNKKTLVTPTYLRTISASKISSACSCVVTVPAPTTAKSSHRSSYSINHTSTPRSSYGISHTTSHRSSYTTSHTTSHRSSYTSSHTSSHPSSYTSSHTTSHPSSYTTSHSGTTTSGTTSWPTTTPVSYSTSSESSTTSTSTSTTSDDGSTETFTAVEEIAQASPTTCPTLPTPTASLIAVPIGGEDPEDSYLKDLFFTQDLTQLLYMSALGDDGNIYIIDLTRDNEICIFDASGNSICIDSDGVQLTPSDCSASIDINIANFAGQIAVQAGDDSTQQKRRSLLEKRFVEKNFLVAVQLTNQCQKPVTDLTPGLTLGPTPCHLGPDFGNGQFTFECQFPGENTKEMKCEKLVQQILLDTIAGGLIGSATNWGTVGGLLRDAMKKFISEEAILGALEIAGIVVTAPEWLLAVAVVAAQGIAILAAVEVALAVYQHLSPNGLPQDVCMLFNADEFPLPLTLAAGLSTEVFTNFAATDQPSDMQRFAVINDPNDHSCSTCTAGGTCSTYTNCGTGSSCFCGVSTEDVNFCFLNDLCANLAQCTGSGTCGAGFLCLAGNCCGFNVCIDATTCAPAPTRFKQRGLPMLARSNSTSVGGLTPIGWVDSLES